MSDYKIGSSGKGSKDRYMVGHNGGMVYKVGGGGKSVDDSSNEALGGGDQGSPTGKKSAFSYKDVDTKDVGDRSENMNFGGANSMGKGSDPTGPSGQLDLTYSEKGDWDAKKDAMARRKAMMEATSKYLGNGDGYNTPTADLVSLKK